MWKLHLQDVIPTYRDRAELDPAAYAVKVLQLTRGVEHLLARAPPDAETAKFRNRMEQQRARLLGCLSDPAAEPTNNRAERALRPAVISRKLSCGNRTACGQWAWERLRSVYVTLTQQGTDPITALATRLRPAPQ